MPASRRAGLKDGDQIRIGRAMLKFLRGGNVEAQYHEEIYRLMTIDGLNAGPQQKRHFQGGDRARVRARQALWQPFALGCSTSITSRKINDTHGHLAGDEVLRGMGNTAQEACCAPTTSWPAWVARSLR